ncbi:MAG: response regulator transcription factor [Planctomycetaceae bacterium]|nr:response regulator transcription factor [Planctomycetaceae bacterium]
MIQKRGRIARRRKKAAPTPTEFDNPKKRKDFTVFLVEDDQSLRQSMRDGLEKEKVKVEDYMTGMEFYRDYREPRPGVLILDIRLPGLSGPEIQDKLIKENFDLPIIMISGHADVPMAVRAMKDGAYDFLCKPVKIEDLLAAVSRAYHYFYEIPMDLDDELDETEDSLSRLTTREREVLDLVVDGLSSREIADELAVSTKTVEAHRARINDKMRADNVAHLIRMCFNFNAAEEA